MQQNWIAVCPKAENHYHIDSIPAKLAWKFAKRNQMKLPFETLDEMQRAFKDASTSLDAFFSACGTAINTIKTERDCIDMVIACAEDMRTQNIIYREVMFNYTACYGARGMTLDTVLHGFAEGLKVAKERYGTDIRFIANLDRTADVECNCT